MGTERPALRIRMLGPLSVERARQPVALPPSRKARALLAFLALAPGPVSRGALCDLLWDGPDDPRAELRWCLSRLRDALEQPGEARLAGREDAIELDRTDCFVDALEVASAVEAGVGEIGRERQRRLASLFAGDFLEGLEIDRSPAFGAWLTAQRRRFRACHAALLEALALGAEGEEALRHVEKWLELAPFDKRAHEVLLAALASQGRLPEAEEHLEAAVRRFEDEGLDASALRFAWRALRRPGAAAAPEPREAPSAPRRASIAVMPFADPARLAGAHAGIADALAHDIISRLARLRALFVIARGTVFALQDRSIGAEDAGRILNVDYVVSGAVRPSGSRLAVTASLSESRSARIVWSETFDAAPGDAFALVEDIGNRIVASVASEIEMLERNRAVLKPPASLDAWEAYHRGLWHMYRYRPADNALARQFFERSIELDPTFSRAYAGLSFTHFQGAFQNWEPRALEVERAYKSASESLLADDRDPAAHWAMGRALWLRGRPDESLTELERTIDLSPNFALGHYNLAFVRCIAGDPHAAIENADHSRALSPFDPMLFGMLASRAMALVRLGNVEEAATWAVKAAARPNSFPHIHAIAAYCLALTGSMDQARAQAAAALKVDPHYDLGQFFEAFPFSGDAAALFRKGAKLVGMK